MISLIMYFKLISICKYYILINFYNFNQIKLAPISPIKFHQNIICYINANIKYKVIKLINLDKK